jgi:hypothetical protein
MEENLLLEEDYRKTFSWGGSVTQNEKGKEDRRLY